MASFYSSTLIALLLLVACSTEAISQGSLSLYDLDAGSFPTIRAKMLATDDAGYMIPGLRPEDIRVTENGIARTVTRLTCSAGQMPQPLSLAISFDLSSSMQRWDLDGGEMIPFTLGQHALRYLANAVPLPRSEMALQGFDYMPIGGIPLTRDRKTFLQEVDRLPMMWNNTFDEGLFNPTKGTLNAVKLGAHRKVAILVSDVDACGGSGDQALLRRYIDTCAKYSIRFYAIIFRTTNDRPFSYQALVDATGGRFYDSIRSRAQVEAAITEILEREQEVASDGTGCEIEWQSLPGCPALREAIVTIPGHSLSATVEYRAPATAVPELRIEPAGWAFGPMPPGSTGTRTVTLTASRFPVTIGSIDGIEPPFSIDGLSLPFTLQPGESRMLTIRFSPTDSVLSFTQLRFNRDDCAPVVVDLSGGVNPTVESLRVVAPNGREKFLAGTTVTLEWTGVGADIPVRLEYSIDKGKSWQTIVENATGLAYQWLVPATPSDSCLLRVSLVGESRRKINFLDASGSHDWCDFSPTESLVAVSNKDYSVSLRDASTTVEVRRLIGHVFNVQWVEFSPDGRHLLSASWDNTVRVWEVATGRLLHVLTANMNTVRIATFSPDGKRILTSSLNSTIIWSLETGGILREFPTGWAIGANFNHDGGQVAIIDAGYTEHNTIIYNAFTGAELHRIPMMGARYVEFSDDGSRLLLFAGAVGVYETATWSHKFWLWPSDQSGAFMAHFLHRSHSIMLTSQYSIEFWDASGRLLSRLPTEGVGATNASFSGDGRRLVSVLGANGTIWDLQGAAVAADLSDSLWSIILPEEPVELVGDFTLADETICEEECIEPVATSIANVTTWEWSFAGGTPSTASGALPGRVCYARAGRFPVRLIVSNATKRDTVTRFVTVISPPPAPVISQSCATLTSTPAASYQWFRDGMLINGATARELQYSHVGSYTVEISNADGCRSRSEPFVTRDEDLSSLDIDVGDLDAAPGEIVQVPVALRFSRPGIGAAWQLTLRLEFNASLLLPIAHAGSARKAGRRSIDVTIGGASFRDTVVSIPFRVALGDAPSTTLRIDTVGMSMACAIELLPRDGMLSLSGLCDNGGTRLVETAEASALKAIRPNPVRGEVSIEYSLVESGQIDIALYDLLGRRVATIVSGIWTQGRYATTYDLSGLASGRYLCVYTTPTERFSEVMVLE